MSNFFRVIKLKVKEKLTKFQMNANDSVGDFTQEFDVFRCMAYELTILRYAYNVLEAKLVQFMLDYPEDTCVGIKQALDPLYRVLKTLVSRSFGDVTIEQSFVPPEHSTPLRNQALNQAITGTQMSNLPPPSNIRIPFVTVTSSTNPNSLDEQQLQSNQAYQMSANQYQLQSSEMTPNRTQRIPNHTYNTNLVVPGQIVNRTMPAQILNLNKTLPAQTAHYDRTMPAHSNNLNVTMPARAQYDRTMPAQSNNLNKTMPVDVDLGVTIPGLQPSFNRTITTQGNLNRTLPGPNRSNTGIAQPVTNQPSYTMLRPGAMKPRWKRNDRQT